jgi:hypothetical protein
MSQGDEDLQAEVERLRRENQELKHERGPRGLQLKVSPKGAVSLYGLGRFPVTLYREQWERVLAMGDEIRAFITRHDAELKKKPRD